MDDPINHPGRTTEDKLVFMVEARLASRRLQGLSVPNTIGCGPRLGSRLHGYRWKEPAYTPHPPELKILPMLRSDTAFLLNGNRILDIISTADPEPEPLPDPGI